MSAPNTLEQDQNQYEQDQNQEQEQNDQNQEQEQSTPSVQPSRDYEAELRMSNEFARRSLESERRIAKRLEEIEEAQRAAATQQPTPQYSDDQLNEAFQQNPIAAMRHMMNQSIAPIRQASQILQFDRDLDQSVDRYIQSNPALAPGRAWLIDGVKRNIGSGGDASFNNVRLVADAVIGNAVLNNRDAFVTLMNPQAAVAPVAPTPIPETPVNNRIVPPRTPNTRPPSNARVDKTELNESEIKAKQTLDPSNLMTNAEFKERMYAEDASINLDINDLFGKGKK